MSPSCRPALDVFGLVNLPVDVDVDGQIPLRVRCWVCLLWFPPKAGRGGGGIQPKQLNHTRGTVAPVECYSSIIHLVDVGCRVVFPGPRSAGMRQVSASGLC